MYRKSLFNCKVKSNQVLVGGRRADEYLEFAWLGLPSTAGTPYAEHRGSYGEIDGLRLASFEAYAPEGLQYLQRAGHGGIFIMDIHLNDLVPVHRTSIGDFHADYRRISAIDGIGRNCCI